MELVSLEGDLRNRLDLLAKKRARIKTGSSSSQILTLLYPDKKLDRDTIFAQIKTQNKKINRYSTLSRLIAKNLLKSENHGCDNTTVFSLTVEGRWFAICAKLKISFLTLCVLADAYVTHTRMDDGLGIGKGFFVFPQVTDLFDGIYTTSQLRWTFEKLKMGGFGAWYNKKTLKLFPYVVKNLRNYYHQDLADLEYWLHAEFQDGVLSILLQDKEILANNLFALGLSMKRRSDLAAFTEEVLSLRDAYAADSN